MKKNPDQWLNPHKRKIFCALMLFFIAGCHTFDALAVASPDHEVKGKVTDSKGAALPGVNILVKDSQTGTITDKNGDYSLRVSTGSDILVFSFIGFQSQTIPLAGRSILNVALTEDISTLDEVVVTALGIKREQRSLGYAFSEVRMDSLTKANDPNFINSLAGKVPGLIISQSAGGPMGASRVVIRGNTSISGDNQPLYVIDGVPIQNSDQGDLGGGKFAGSDGKSHDVGDIMSSLNPNDIESISVLKGPSASALYGSLASNGVIMITMKKGSKKAVEVELNSTITFEKQATKYDNAQRIYGQGINGMLPTDATASQTSIFNSWGPRLDPNVRIIGFDGVERPYALANNGLDAFLRTGQTYTNSLTLSQSLNKSSFRLAYTNLTSKDIVPKTGMSRHSFNLGSSTRINDRLSIDSRILYTHETVDNRPALGDAVDNIAKSFFGLANNLSPTMFGENYKTADGSYVEWGGGRYNYNPYWVINDMENTTVKTRLMGGLTINYDFGRYFNLRLMGSRDENNTDFEKYSPVTSPNALLGSLEQTTGKITTSQADAMLSFDKEITKTLRLTTRLGANYYQLTNGGFANVFSRMTITDVISPNSFTDKSINQLYSKRVKNSVYGIMALSYKDYLYLDATWRRDASSTLPIANNTYSYPSLSGSFVFSDAFNLPTAISFGKIRASAAEVGSDTNPYMLGLTYQLYPFTINDQSAGSIAITTIPNKELKPTRTRSFETGFEMKFFTNRLGIDFTYYTQRSRDQINTVPAPQSSGYARQIVNVGSISNSGYELVLDGQILAKTAVKWRSQFNIARNINRVESLAEGLPFLTLAEARWLGVSIVAKPGEPYGAIMGYNYQRDPQGNIILDASTRRPLQSETKEVLGKGIYDWTGGMMNTFSYQNISLAFGVDFKFGADLFSMTNLYYVARGSDKSTLEGRDEWIQSEKDREAAGATSQEWLAAGNQRGYVPQGVIRSTDAEGNAVFTPNTQGISPYSYWSGHVIDGQGVSTPFIYDASYIKIRDISLSYRLKKSMISTIGLSDVSISLVARNPLIIYKNVPNIDPESNVSRGNGQGIEYGSLPQRRGYGVNLKIKF